VEEALPAGKLAEEEIALVAGPKMVVEGVRAKFAVVFVVNVCVLICELAGAEDIDLVGVP
jgi:hypothetical protein